MHPGWVESASVIGSIEAVYVFVESYDPAPLLPEVAEDSHLG